MEEVMDGSPRYLRRGRFEEFAKDVLAILGPGLCPSCGCAGCKYEVEQVVLEAKAVLGLPVPRQRCKACGALDKIYWHKDDPKRPELEDQFGHGPMSCHNCGTVNPESEWIELPVDEQGELS